MDTEPKDAPAMNHLVPKVEPQPIPLDEAGRALPS